jgi:glycosyltransferase involved in cell wall biosynthesis
MLEGQNIICFAKDWTEDPTSNNHVMRMLARRNRVLWLNSISMRTPNLASGRDLAKIARKLRSFARGPVQVEPGLWVYTPIVLPLPHSRAAAAINRVILRASLRLLRRKLGMDRYQLWTFVPNALPYLGMPGESLVVYYCIDEWSHFSYLDGARMADTEQRLCKRADVVLATANLLWERRRPLNPETHLALHGVDHRHFAAALAPETPVAEELAGAGPVVGFFGLIHEWIDLGLVAALAERRPDWTIALIGKASVNVSALRRYPNVKLLGRKPYEQLPRYCKAMSVGIIPFAVNELTRNVNPIKLREYLSAGLPVVSTALPEVEAYAGACRIARTPDEFVAACDEVIRTDTPALRHRRSEAMAKETWEAKVNDIGGIVAAAQRRRDEAAQGAAGPADAAARAREAS